MWESGRDVTTASTEEMLTQVKADACAAGPMGERGCGVAGAELPWSSTEEMLAPPADASPQGVGLVLALAGVMVLAIASLVAGRSRLPVQKLGLVLAAAMLAFGLGLVSGIALVWGFCCCSAVL